MSAILFKPETPPSPTPAKLRPPIAARSPGVTGPRPPWRARLRGLVPNRRHLLIAGAVLALPATAMAALAIYGTAPRQRPLGAVAFVPPAADPSALDERTLEKLTGRLAGSRPRGVYVTVDTYRNRLRVHKNDAMMREAVCSTGSGAVVRDPRSGRLWIFDTPIGERRVQTKTRNPVWNKPDWAFVEEGYLPPKKQSLRVDEFSLGDYGLYLGDGYIIHGTVFQTLLGQAITHGCIRLGDKDLEFVYQNVPTGARVYLY